MKTGIFLISVFFFLVSAKAQLCTGSLGDPVVNMTFGNAQTPAGPLAPGVTSMNYTTANCPNDGFYTITNEAPRCFGNTWHTLFSDHTGDVGGRVMLINASFEPSDFFIDTVRGLCGNTIYQFASWITNVLLSSSCSGNGIRPNLTFRIETVTGTVLKEFQTGNIGSEPTVIWKQYGTFFQTPAGNSSVVLRIRNNAPGGCGNDIALDDITFRPCGPEIKAFAAGNTSGFIEICENDKRDFNFTATYSNEFQDPVLQWQESKDTGKTWMDIQGATNSTYLRSARSNGLYLYRVAIVERENTSKTCRVASNITQILVHPLPNKSPEPFIRGCTGSQFTLEAVSGPGFSYNWTGPNGFTATSGTIQMSSVQFSDSGLYLVNIQTPAGCNRKDSFQVQIFQGVTATVTTDGNICEGSGKQLVASGGSQYQWSPAMGLSSATSATTFASPVDSTLYRVIVSNEFECTDTAYTNVYVWKKPLVDAGNDLIMFEGGAITIPGNITGAFSSFYWSPLTSIINSSTLSPTVNPASTTVYTLHAVSAWGCGEETDAVTVTVYPKITPVNIFSPNGDGIHDTWQIPGLHTYPQSIVSVYARSGQMVYEAKAYNNNWNGSYKGKPLPIGTYYYIIHLNTGQAPLTGWVVIIR